MGEQSGNDGGIRRLLIEAIDTDWHSASPEELADEILARDPDPTFMSLASLADSSGRPLFYAHELAAFRLGQVRATGQ